ncbi:MAG: cadmium resistance transporter [Anaerolineae bacterium]|nr:cadmium resistance transporter [Anaerolineae bacterium]
MELIGLLALGMAVFASTNVDDIFILTLLFSDHRFTPRQVIAGQFTGIILIIGLSLAGSLAAFFVPVKLLGLFPLLIGVKKLADLFTSSVGDKNAGLQPGEGRRRASARRSSQNEASVLTRQTAWGSRTLAVAAVTFANGGDNLSIYTPLFATHTPLQVIFLTLVFLLMTAVWCLVSYTFMEHTGQQVQRIGRVVLPFVLMGLGLWIIGGLE